MKVEPGHIVCIFGGGVAGSEAAACMAERGIRSVVFEMGALPWGKIELGLPKWHHKQRDLEEGKIDANLEHPLVTYVPLTKLGRDIELEEILDWGFSAVLLATGAWRDRPLDVHAVDEFIGRGFHYQNAFVSWFNQYHAPDYEGPELEVVDGAAVVGGGLASLDVVKILMLETTQAKLQERGIGATLFELEKKGIPKVLGQFGVKWEDLGLQGCTLYYRRRGKDMPLVPVDDEQEITPERELQLQKVREKLLDNFLKKYLFKFRPCCLPIDKIVEDERLTGLIFRKTRIEDGRVMTLEGSDFEVRTPLVISSIGSLPECVPGLSMHRDLFRVENMETGKLHGFDNVFALGNAVTGRGNIRASRVHGRSVSEWIIENFLGWSAEDGARLRGLLSVDGQNLELFVKQKGLKSVAQIESILEKSSAYQKRVGYQGTYHDWIRQHSPIRLEHL